MKTLKKLIILLSAPLMVASIILTVNHIVQKKKDLHDIISLSLPKQAQILMVIALLLLFVVFVIPYFTPKIKKLKYCPLLYKFRKLKNRPENIVKNLNQPEKNILKDCFIDYEVSYYETTENDVPISILLPLYDKKVVKLVNKYESEYQIIHYVFKINDHIKNYLLKNKEVLY